MSDSALTLLILVVAIAASTAFSYYDLPRKRHKLVEGEIRLSRALSDGYAFALIVGFATLGSHIGDAHLAPHLGTLAGCVLGFALAVLTRDRLGRRLALATRQK